MKRFHFSFSPQYTSLLLVFARPTDVRASALTVSLLQVMSSTLLAALEAMPHRSTQLLRVALATQRGRSALSPTGRAVRARPLPPLCRGMANIAWKDGAPTVMSRSDGP